MVQKKFGPKKFWVQKFWSKKILVQKNFGPKKIVVQKKSSPKKLVPKKFGPKNFGSKIYFLPNGDRLQCQHSCQKLGVEGLSNQCPMTFPTMFQASSIYKSCKWKLSAAYGNYSGSGRLGSGRLGSARLTCDYNAISVQLQLQLPTGTEVGKSQHRGKSTIEMHNRPQNSHCTQYVIGKYENEDSRSK